MQEQSQQGLEIDPYFPQSKTQNTHKMAEWSVMGTQMHYVQHPHVQEGLLLNQCEEKIESQIVGKMENPNLLSLEGESKQIKDGFTDRFDGVVHYLWTVISPLLVPADPGPSTSISGWVCFLF